MNSKAYSYAAFAEAIQARFHLSGRTDALEGIDIENEYALIQQKKSMLSAMKRRAVVFRYEIYLEQRKASS